MTEWLSRGVQNLCTMLRAHGGRSAFPGGYSLERAAATETTADWFRRCVDLYMNGDPRRCAIDDHLQIGVVGVLDTNKAGEVGYLNLQAVVVREGFDLDDLYLGRSDVDAAYIRLDFDPTRSLGPMFREPQPHLHHQHDGAPWQPFPSHRPVADFAEMLFRNWHHDRWMEWAAAVWSEARKASGKYDPRDDPFPVLVSAFNGSNIELLRSRAPQLEEIRGALRRELDASHRAAVDPAS
jgi:hypothetical protein